MDFLALPLNLTSHFSMFGLRSAASNRGKFTHVFLPPARAKANWVVTAVPTQNFKAAFEVWSPFIVRPQLLLLVGAHQGETWTQTTLGVERGRSSFLPASSGVPLPTCMGGGVLEGNRGSTHRRG